MQPKLVIYFLQPLHSRDENTEAQRDKGDLPAVTCEWTAGLGAEPRPASQGLRPTSPYAKGTTSLPHDIRSQFPSQCTGPSHPQPFPLPSLRPWPLSPPQGTFSSSKMITITASPHFFKLFCWAQWPLEELLGLSVTLVKTKPPPSFLDWSFLGLPDPRKKGFRGTSLPTPYHTHSRVWFGLVWFGLMILIW